MQHVKFSGTVVFNVEKMKVTVCFGSIKIVVPCGGGDITVKELIEKAIVRYKKAVGKVRTVPIISCLAKYQT